MPRLRGTLPPAGNSFTYGAAPLSIAECEQLYVRTPPTIFNEETVYAAPPRPAVQAREQPAGRPSIGHREGMGRLGGPTDAMPISSPRSIHPSTFYPLIPTEDQAIKLAQLSVAAERFASVIDATLDFSMDKESILRKVREIALWTREAVLRYPDGSPRETPEPPSDPVARHLSVGEAISAYAQANPCAAGATVRPEPAQRWGGFLRGPD